MESASSGKHRAISLLRHPEALQGPPTGPAGRNSVIAMLVLIGLVVAAIVVVHSMRSQANPEPRFEAATRPIRCPANVAAGVCYRLRVVNAGDAAGARRCTLVAIHGQATFEDGSSTFQGANLQPGMHVTETVLVLPDPQFTDSTPTVSCEVV